MEIAKRNGTRVSVTIIVIPMLRSVLKRTDGK